MKERRTIHIEVSAADVEKIVTDHVSSMMYDNDYQLEYVDMDGQSWPDVRFRGVHEEDVDPAESIVTCNKCLSIYSAVHKRCPKCGNINKQKDS